ncbi:hypothetical protein ACFSUS_19595 [Spirosoma soli]|uniref:Lipocalin-like domain-containing protein n=1 Tax=Spirosoma soli TaxID=1770529 RepID=A0ABW5M7A6_9BACT
MIYFSNHPAAAHLFGEKCFIYHLRSMRKLLATALFVTAVTALSACEDTNTKKLLKTIDGRWQIKTATYSGGTTADSIASFKTAAFVFDRCSSSANGGSPTNCTLSFIDDNDRPFAFSYQAPNKGESLYFTPAQRTNDSTYQRVIDQIAGSYQVVTLSENLLVIRRSLQAPGSLYKTVEYSASR